LFFPHVDFFWYDISRFTRLEILIQTSHSFINRLTLSGEFIHGNALVSIEVKDKTLFLLVLL